MRLLESEGPKSLIGPEEFALPLVEPEEFAHPSACPYQDCCHPHLRLHQLVPKLLRDPLVKEVKALRYQCLRCTRTFRIYPTGVNRNQTSLLVKALVLLLYILNLSYSGVVAAMSDLGVKISKSQVYNIVQAAALRIPGLTGHRKQTTSPPPLSPLAKSDYNPESDPRHFPTTEASPSLAQAQVALTCSVMRLSSCDRDLHIGIARDANTGLILSIDDLGETTPQSAASVSGWLLPIAQTVATHLVVSSGKGAVQIETALELVAQELGVEHKVCGGQAVRHFQDLVQALKTEIEIEGVRNSDNKSETLAPASILVSPVEVVPAGTKSEEGVVVIIGQEEEAAHYRRPVATNTFSFTAAATINNGSLRNQEEPVTNSSPLIEDLNKFQALLNAPFFAFAPKLDLVKQQQRSELEELHKRYLSAKPPGKGEKASLSYRLRMFFLRLWNTWPRLTNCGCHLCHLKAAAPASPPPTLLGQAKAASSINKVLPSLEQSSSLPAAGHLGQIYDNGLFTATASKLSEVRSKILSALIISGMHSKGICVDFLSKRCRQMRGKARSGSMLKILQLMAWCNNQISLRQTEFECTSAVARELLPGELKEQDTIIEVADWRGRDNQPVRICSLDWASLFEFN